MSSRVTATTGAGMDERTPLITSRTTTQSDTDSISSTSTITARHESDKPLPKAQIFMLCYARMVEAIAFFYIFPFVNQMVQDEGNISEEDVGFYSGILESLFSLTQMCVTMFWGKAGDRYGRKPVLVVSLVGISIATGLFGVSKSLWQMMLFRCLAGAFGGTVVTIRTMFAELSTSRTQALAFSYFAFFGNLGMFLGPLIGGATVVDTRRHDTVIAASTKPFEKYPYALPALIAASIGLTAAATSWLFVHETLPETLRHSPASTIDSPKPRTSTWKLMRCEGVPMVLFLYGFGNVLVFGFTAVQPVYYFTSVLLGGYGLTTFQISLFLGINGGAAAVWLLVVFPLMHRRFGTTGMLRLSAYIFPPFFASYPLLNLLLRSSSAANADDVRVAFFVLAPVALSLGTGISMSFTALQLALNDASPTPEALSSLNALALTLVSGVRSFSPALFTSIYAIGVKQRILHGQLFWVVVIVLSVGFCVAVNYQPESPHRSPDALKDDIDRDEEARV